MPVMVTVTCDTNRICTGQQMVFNALSINGGDDPFYQWFVNGDSCGTNDPYYISSTLENGDTVHCSVTSNAICVSDNPGLSNKVGMTVISDPDPLQTPDGPTYIDLFSSLISSYETNHDTNISVYNWVITPAEAYSEMVVVQNELEVTWSGTYMGQASIKVYGENDCESGPVSDSLVVTLDNTTAIGETVSDLSFGIYPNPGTGLFNITIKSVSSAIINISVRNSLGGILLEEEYSVAEVGNTKQIDLSACSEGIYFVFIRQDDKLVTRKLILDK